jgi:hypothetical protein
MKPDDFEKQLQRQPMRAIPGEWRADILQAANNAASRVPESQRFPAASARVKINWWLELLGNWRGHAAGLAFVWLLIFALKATTPEAPQPVIAESPAGFPEMMVARQEQQRLLAELFEPAWSRPVERSRSVAPRPRSELPAMRRSALFGGQEFLQTSMS